MNEKTAEERHIEHGQMVKNIDLLMKRDEERTNKLTEFIVEHSEKDGQLRQDILNEIRTLERGIGEKTSMDSALMGRQNRIEKDFVEIERRQENLMKVTERLAMTAEQQGKDISASHEKNRDLADRVDAVEKVAGKVAIAAWKYVGGSVVGTIVVALLVAFLTGLLKIGGTP